MIKSQSLEHCDFVDPQGHFLRYNPTRLKTIWTIFKSKFVKVNPQRNRNIVVPDVCALIKLSQIVCHYFQCLSQPRSL